MNAIEELKAAADYGWVVYKRISSYYHFEEAHVQRRHVQKYKNHNNNDYDDQLLPLKHKRCCFLGEDEW